ncbi:MAG: hypothetical protein VKO21_12630 [Candidatus Sericytochromatia bacterium]|nr:hypothetical protein [Candidatus Sericytochromatia bacterium]
MSRSLPGWLPTLLAAGLLLTGCQGRLGSTVAAGTVFASSNEGGAQGPIAVATPVHPDRLLVGEVRVPPAFAGTLGGQLVADAAAGLVGHAAGGLTAPAGRPRHALKAATTLVQQAIADVQVALVDARGLAISDEAGRPLITRTDASGRFTLSPPASTRPARLQVGPDPATAFGRLVLPGTDRADVDLSSTLVARYCVDQFLSDQPDPERALARLPADVEAATVARTEAVLADTAELLAERDRLDDRTVTEAVQLLRTRHTAVQEQFETVRKLLVVAGLFNLGDGEPATEVALSDVRGLLTAPDGGLYLNCPEDRRIWWLRADGTLKAVVGRVSSDLNVAGPEVGPVAQMWSRPDGSLILLEEDRKADDIPPLWRLTPAGRLEEIPHGLVNLQAAVPLDNRRLLLITTALDQMATCWELEPGGTPTRLSSFSMALDWGLSQYPPAITRAAALSDGRIRLASSVMLHGRVLDVDPRSGKVSRWFEGQVPKLPGPALSPDGSVVYVEGFESFRILNRPDAAADAQPLGRQFFVTWSPLLVDDEGRLVLAHDHVVERLERGEWQHLAGRKDTGARQQVYGALEPRSFTVLPDGQLVIVDGEDLVVQQPGQASRILVAAGEVDPLSPTASAHQPLAVVSDPRDGRLFIRANQANSLGASGPKDRIYEVGPEGSTTLRYETPTAVWDMRIGPEGDLYLSEYAFMGPKRVIALDRQGTVREVLGPDAAYFSLSRVGFDLAGILHVENVSYGAAPDYVRTRQVLPVLDGVTGPALPDSAIFPEAFDAQGWTYEGLGLNEGPMIGWTGSLVRWQRQTGRTEVLAGPGGRFFSGTGVDDGIKGARHPVFGPDGDLYFLDMGNRQIKRIPREALAEDS